jgi:hypothetical protein
MAREANCKYAFLTGLEDSSQAVLHADLIMWVGFVISVLAAGTPSPAHRTCQIHDSTFDGWPAQEVSNEWVKLSIVPKLGGRLIQVSFGGHEYLF